MQQKKIKIIISGGGTGGHIFPAIAIANALKNKVQDIQILFVGAKGRMEMEKVPANGYPIVGLWISGFQRRLTIDNLMFPFKVLVSLYRSRKIIKEFQPDVVVGFGGYASGPMLQAAAKMGISTAIWEGNSFAGVTNKILAKSTTKIFVAFDGMERFFPKEKIVQAGNPIRQEVTELEGKRAEALRFFGLNENKKILLVIGGSLGALTINESIQKNLELFKQNSLQVIWQTGKNYYEIAREVVKPFENYGIKAFDFISHMDFAYAVADLVISRAGAIAISELCSVSKPVILIPSPNVAEDHQTKNAMTLVNNHAAVLVRDSEARQKLGPILIDLLNNIPEQQLLQENIKKLAFKDSANNIADEILKLIK